VGRRVRQPPLGPGQRLYRRGSPARPAGALPCAGTAVLPGAGSGSSARALQVVNPRGTPVIITLSKPKKWKISTNTGIAIQVRPGRSARLPRPPPRPRRRRARAPRDPAGLPDDRVGVRGGGARGAARRQGAPRQGLRHQRPVRARARPGAPPTRGAALTRGARRYGAFGKIDDVAVCLRRAAPGAAGRVDP